MCPCHFFLRRDGVLGISHLVVILFHQCITFCNKCQLCSRWLWRRCTWSDQWYRWIYRVPTFSLLWYGLRESVPKSEKPLPECWCFLFPSLHCPLFLMFFLLNFGISFFFRFNFFFSRKNLPANWKGVLFHETWQGFDVAFYWSAARPQGHAPKWGAKTVNFFRGQILEVCFLKSNLFLNQFMGCVDLYDFHENCPRS